MKVKNSIITFSLVAVTLPFLLLTDLFPFLRFGMFAEPVKRSVQTETFMLTFLDSTGKEKAFDPSSIGIEPHFFFYLTRNYFYRGEVEAFFTKVDKASGTTVKEWRLKRAVSSTSGKRHTDTTVVARKSYD